MKRRKFFSCHTNEYQVMNLLIKKICFVKLQLNTTVQNVFFKVVSIQLESPKNPIARSFVQRQYISSKLLRLKKIGTSAGSHTCTPALTDTNLWVPGPFRPPVFPLNRSRHVRLLVDFFSTARERNKTSSSWSHIQNTAVISLEPSNFDPRSQSKISE